MIKLQATDHFHDSRVGAIKRYQVFLVNDELVAKDLAHVSKPYSGKDEPINPVDVEVGTVTTLEEKAKETPLNKANPTANNKAK